MQVVDVIHNDDHTVDFTVKVDAETLAVELKKAARRVSKEVRIPGFRPGKVPYNIVEKSVGREALVWNMLENMGDDLYRDALDELEIKPYDMGEIKDINSEEAELAIIFSVPKSAEVDLKDYRNVRVDYEEPEVTEKQVDNALRGVVKNTAVTEAVERPAEVGDQLIVQIHSFFVDEDAEETEKEDAEGEEEHDHDHDHDHDHHNDDREPYVHEHDYSLLLEEDPEFDPFIPGFSKELVGAEAGETRTFTLTFPTDDEEYREELRGRSVEFEITVTKVNARIEPPYNDFAAVLASNGESENLEELREEVVRLLENMAEENTNETYLDKVLGEIIEGSAIAYPAAMVESYLDDMMKDMDNDLRRQYGLALDDYVNIVGQSKEQLREDRREQAIKNLENLLVMQELIDVENLYISDEDINSEIDKEISQYGDLAGSLREYFYGNAEMRNSLANRLASERIQKRVIDIAKGLEPAIGPDGVEADAETEGEDNAPAPEDDASDSAEASATEQADSDTSE